MQNAISKIAEFLRSSRRTLFLTSAGMSADSGIPTFRDRDGYWENFPPFKAKNLEPQILASPWAFRNLLPHAWAFYEWRRRNASENTPHEGYHIINRWTSLNGNDCFIHTTNTDGYHTRSGAPPNAVKEVHGSMWRLQCLDACSSDFWRSEEVPLCTLDLKTMCASDFPVCRNCGGVARPHILMFDDFEYTGYSEQDREFSSFISKEIDLVFLIGSSGAVPTNDYIAKSLLDRGSVVVNINPDPKADSIAGVNLFLKMNSLDALTAIDSKFRRGRRAC